MTSLPTNPPTSTVPASCRRMPTPGTVRVPRSPHRAPARSAALAGSQSRSTPWSMRWSMPRPADPLAPASVVLACPVCEVSAGPYPTWGEAALLADRHDQVHHRGRATTQLTDASVCESCRRAPATVSWLRVEAGAPFALCANCHPDHGDLTAATAATGQGTRR